MKLRLALFTNQFPSKVSTFFARDLSFLISRGYDIDIFPIYPINSQYWENVPESLREKIRESIDLKFISPIHFLWQNLGPEIVRDVRSILKESLQCGPVQFLKSLSVIQQAIAWSRYFDGKYDYMLSYWGNYAGTYAYIANKLLKKNIPFSFFLHAGTDLYRDRIFLEQKILYASRVFTVCDFNKTFLKEAYSDSFDKFKHKIVIYHLGIDFSDILYRIDGREINKLLTIGSFSRQKGFSNAIKAISFLGNDLDLQLIMIGDGPERKRLIRLARILKVENRVKFLGWVPYEIVKEYLAKCTILVHPSSSLGDAVPTVIKEALVAGLPIIGSDIAGIPELLDYGKAGMLFQPNNYIELANSIRRLLLDPNFGRVLAERGRIYAEENFDMWKNGELLSESIESDIV